MVASHLVELIAVDQQIAASVRGDVHVVALDADVAERSADVLARRLVVVARDEYHVRILARAAQDLLHQGVLRARPVHAAPAHRPEIDDVAEQKQVLGLVGLEKFEQALGLAGARPQVHVGDEDGPHAPRRLIFGRVRGRVHGVLIRMRRRFQPALQFQCSLRLVRQETEEKAKPIV